MEFELSGIFWVAVVTKKSLGSWGPILCIWGLKSLWQVTAEYLEK